MTKQEALTQCIGGSAITHTSLEEGESIQFINGQFVGVQPNGDRFDASDLIADESTGFSLYTSASTNNLAMHISNGTGEVYFSLEGSNKCSSRDNNSRLRRASGTELQSVLNSALNS